MITVEATDTPSAAALAIRRAVFIDEQGVAEVDELDGSDAGCRHWILREDGAAVATLRTIVDGDTLKIARVATVRMARGRGHGAALLRAALAWGTRAGLARATMGAQTDVLAFYERFGFVAHGPIFDDAGIPHRHMVLDLHAP